MVSRVITLRPDMEIFKAIRVLLSRRISGAPVLGPRGELVGMLSEKDCLKILASRTFHEDTLPGAVVRDFMSTGNLVTTTPDTDIFSIAGLFLKHVYRRLPVIDGGRLVGQVSRRDVLKGIEEMAATTGRGARFPDYRQPQFD